MNRKEWKIKKQAGEEDVRRLVEESGISEIFAALCVQRGITSLVDLKRMTEPDLSLLHDPFLLFEMEKAVEQIGRAHV